MTTVLRDSTNPANIPVGTPIVGGYVDGLYGLGTKYWNAAAWAQWAARGARLRRIAAVTTTTPSNTGDFENFDLTAADAPVWHHNMLLLGETDLWAYVSSGLAPGEVLPAPGSLRRAVEDALWAAGVPADACSMWIATLNGVVEQLTPYRYPIAAQQWVDRGPYDESVVYQTFGPAPDPGPVPSTWRNVIVSASSDSYIVFGIGTKDDLCYFRWDTTTNKWVEGTLGGSWTDFSVSGAGQRLDVYARGTAPAGVAWHCHSADAGVSWSAWQELGGVFKGPLVAAGPAPSGSGGAIVAPLTLTGSFSGTAK